jgi:hypothetical protein
MNNEVREKILACVKAAGFSEGGDNSDRYDTTGMPGEREVCVLPEYSFGDGIVGDGMSTVVVTPTYAQQFFRPCPYNHTRWHARGEAVTYTDPAGLVAALEKLCRKSKGCW